MRLFLLTICALFRLPFSALAISCDEEAVLSSPGLRPRSDPSIVIPSSHTYTNAAFALPAYKDATGVPAVGWSSRLIATRRLSSSESARLYYREKDLAGAFAFHGGGTMPDMLSWPEGALLILEVFAGDGASEAGGKPREVEAMLKGKELKRHYLSSDWSYAVFTSGGKPAMANAERIRQCHGCHTAAFHVTGDLIFTEIR